jgi:hypothetical protein
MKNGTMIEMGRICGNTRRRLNGGWKGAAGLLVPLGAVCLLWMALAGCASMPDPSSAASRQQAQADLVVNFQSWNAIAFIKPDLTDKANRPADWPKTFTRDGVVKLLNNLKMPREFVVVVLDRRHDPDPMVAAGGMDAIQRFFEGLGFRRVSFHDGSGWNRAEDLPVLRDTAVKPGQ